MRWWAAVSRQAASRKGIAGAWSRARLRSHAGLLNLILRRAAIGEEHLGPETQLWSLHGVSGLQHCSMQAKARRRLGRCLWRALPQTKSVVHRCMRGVDHALQRLLAAHGIHGIRWQHELTWLEHAGNGIRCSIHRPRALTLFVVS